MRAFLSLPSTTQARAGGPGTIGARHAGLLPVARLPLARSLLAILWAAALALALALAMATPRPASAQFPAELAGRVVDAVTGAPVEGARVQAVGWGRTATTGGDGEFRIRGLEPGRLTLRIDRLGYMTATRSIELRNGELTQIRIELGPRPVELAGLEAGAERDRGDAITITREELRRSGARNAADAVEGRAGVVIRSQGPTGPRTVSVRGGAPGEVLVLIDGAPLNGPVTGDVDLSSIPASQIESITVLRGGHSARHGPGAQSGVILIRTRATGPPAELRLGAGSLDTREIEGTAGARALGLDWNAGGHLRAVEGAFEFSSPIDGDRTGERRNADLSERGLFLAGTGRLGGGELRTRAGYSGLERGLPGRSFLPSEHARERMHRWRAQAAWERGWRAGALAVNAYGLVQRWELRDSLPPIGPAYDSRTDARVGGLRATGELYPAGPDGIVRSLSGGVELRGQDYESTTFASDAPDGRTDLGLFGGAELVPASHPSIPRWIVMLRVDRDGLDGGWRVTHELTARSRLGPLDVHLRHASSYSPPTFGDQFFREGVAVEPNPDLRAERVPNELALGLALSGRLGAASWRADVEGYVADVRDMIVWSPDFRFIWSPRNFDVERRGADATLTLALPDRGLELRGSYSLARVTYDRPGPDDVQVVYRPRHTGGAQLRWSPAGWDLSLDARYMGRRYPVPARLNALDPFWSMGLRVRRTLGIGSWSVAPALTIDRLTDVRDAFIYGYPEPGRTLRLEIEIRPGRPDAEPLNSREEDGT